MFYKLQGCYQHETTLCCEIMRPVFPASALKSVSSGTRQGMIWGLCLLCAKWSTGAAVHKQNVRVSVHLSAGEYQQGKTKKSKQSHWVASFPLFKIFSIHARLYGSCHTSLQIPLAHGKSISMQMRNSALMVMSRRIVIAAGPPEHKRDFNQGQQRTNDHKQSHKLRPKLQNGSVYLKGADLFGTTMLCSRQGRWNHCFNWEALFVIITANWPQRLRMRTPPPSISMPRGRIKRSEVDRK